jgi:predicted Zn-dependent protease
VSSRVVLFAVVGVLAAAAAGAVVGVTLATRQTPPEPQAIEGKPPVGENLTTPVADEIRDAFERWPDGSIETMQRLGRERPDDPQVQLYRGIALIWAGYPGEAEPVLRAAKRAGRDTPWEIHADDLLHPQFFPGLPIFEPESANPLLREGSELQRRGQQHSAARLYRLAARRSPNDPEALVANAVGRFSKDNPSAAFSQLGPLSRRYPENQAVRFYLGLLLAWIGESSALDQFRRAVELGPDTNRGRLAAAFIDRSQSGQSPETESPGGSGTGTTDEPE